MPLPPVVVEISAPDARIRETAALLDACSEAVAEGECVLGDVSRDSGSRRAVALVEWRGPSWAHIEVGAKRRDQKSWRIRDLRFRPEDDINARWTSVGLAIGTLVGELVPEEPPAPKPEEPVPKPPSPAAPVESAPVEASFFHVDAAGFAGPAVGSGTWWLAGFFRGAYTPSGSAPGGIVGVSAMYGVRTRDDAGLGLRSLVLALGAGYAFLGFPDAFGLEVRGEGLGELLAVSVLDPSSSARDSEARWRGGLRAGLDASWRATPALGILAGVEASWFATSPQVTVRDVRRDTLPAFRYGGFVGLRLWPNL